MEYSNLILVLPVIGIWVIAYGMLIIGQLTLNSWMDWRTGFISLLDLIVQAGAALCAFIPLLLVEVILILTVAYHILRLASWLP